MIRNLLKNNCCSALAFVCAGLMACASGCGKKEQAPAPAPTSQKAPATAQMAVQKPVSSALKLTPPEQKNQFDFSNKKDPFKPLVAEKKAGALTAEQQKKALKDTIPILSFDVGQFKLIGVIVGDKGNNKAMVVDPNRKGYVLKVGMSIGKNDGRVTSINTDGVTVVEQFRDDNGRVRKEVIKITLPRKQ